MITPTRFIKILLPLFILIALSFFYNIHELLGLDSYVKSILDNYDASFGAPATESSPKLKGGKKSFKLDDLRKVHRPDHGTFFFGPTSDEVRIPEEFVFDPADDW